ncbi:hypothetical protein [Pantanalinema sp. GBBB05]|uniref:hypothetical protein n=1 Tax=Pantanalinema sp. GBBB05 TaxID=2604139 RepID=UPI001D293D9B|nr:hypothetical protein [Pantanalinema sp. GBBB05]
MILLPTIDFAVWLLIQSGQYVPPFDQHDPTPQIDLNTDLLAPENWTEWCRRIIFIETLVNFNNVFGPYHISDTELIAKSAQHDPKIDLIIRVLDSYPEQYPHQPFDRETIVQWADFNTLNLPESYESIYLDLASLMPRFRSNQQAFMQTKHREKARSIQYQYYNQTAHYRRAVPYVAKVELELTPYVFLHGEVFE